MPSVGAWRNVTLTIVPYLDLDTSSSGRGLLEQGSNLHDVIQSHASCHWMIQH